MIDNNLLLKRLVGLIQKSNKAQEVWRPLPLEEDDKYWENSGDGAAQRHSNHASSHSTSLFVFLTTVIVLILLTTTTLVTLNFGAHQWQLTPRPWQTLTASTSTETDLIESALSLTTSTPSTVISCPSHPSREQREQGSCIFDPILLQWLPKQCINKRVLESTLNTSSSLAQSPYEIAGDFVHQIYSDPELQHQLPLEEVNQIKQHPYYVTLRFHRAHCAYMFRLIGDALGEKARQAQSEAAPDTSSFGNTEGKFEVVGTSMRDDDRRSALYVWREAVTQTHTDHCVEILASREGNLDNSEKFFAGGGTCVLL